MVGKTGFEPATPWSQTKCSTKLSHFPINMVHPIGVEPITFWSVVKRSIQLSYERMHNDNKFKMVAPSGIEPPTQGFSVPCSTDWATEPNKKWRFRPGSNRRSSAWQADVITTTLRNQYGCGRRIWTYDLRVMSPTSYQAAPFRDIVK